MKDFVHVAGPLGVTHLMMLSKTEIGTYLVSKDQMELKKLSIYTFQLSVSFYQQHVTLLKCKPDNYEDFCPVVED